MIFVQKQGGNMKKFIATIILSLTAQYSFGWSCDNAISEFTDVSVRSKCMYRMLSHWIEVAESDLLINYKADLGTSQTYAGSSERRHHTFRKNLLQDLITYYGVLEAMNPSAQRVLITNQTSIPMTCSTARSGSGS